MEIVEIVEKAVKFSEATELIRIYKLNLFWVLILSLMIYAMIHSLSVLTCNENMVLYIVNKILKSICFVLAILYIILEIAPSLVDKTGIMVNYQIKEQVTDKSKYSLEVTENKDYLKFDNKGNDNIKLIHNNKEIKKKVFKLIEETDKEYLLELEVVDKGLFSNTVRTERVSLSK